MQSLNIMYDILLFKYAEHQGDLKNKQKNKKNSKSVHVFLNSKCLIR